MENVKTILNEHNLFDAGGGNNIVGSPSEPTKGNFDGRIWFRTTDKTHFIYYDGRYHPIGAGEISAGYNGMERKFKVSNGEFQLVVKYDENGKVLHRSSLLEPDPEGRFRVRKLETNVGTNGQMTQYFDLTYDEDGDLIKEVPSERW